MKKTQRWKKFIRSGRMKDSLTQRERETDRERQSEMMREIGLILGKNTE